MQLVKKVETVAARGLNARIGLSGARSIRRILATLPLAVALLAGPALATTMTATFKVTTGTPPADDVLGLGTELNGTDILVRFVYDTAVGQLTDIGGVQTLYGGASYGQPVNTQLVIYGISPHHFFGTGSSLISSGPGFFTGSFSSHAFGDPGVDVSITMLGPVPASLTTVGGQHVLTQDNAGILSVTDGTGLHTYGSLRLVAFELANRGIVPEPATWSLMLFGFGGLGVALRGRKRPPQLTPLVAGVVG